MLRVRALHPRRLLPLSFELTAGECLAVLGPSGSGKSLLLRALADLDPCEGWVELDGINWRSLPAPQWRRQMVYVPAESGWWADTVGEHFVDWAPARPLVAALGLPEGVADWPVARLSTGERQRLALVRALALQPRLLLLDEPTSGLDGDSRARVECLVHQALAGGSGALWVTHDTDQARRVARRALRVRGGRVEEIEL
ncbi:MAG: ABC transporter ATP-binding protein [Candidatus Competibacteraceae bacterium]|nr:ABC transporter ATP-binding protein [Candidatus Competibacteraceae bacterium]